MVIELFACLLLTSKVLEFPFFAKKFKDLRNILLKKFYFNFAIFQIFF